MKNKKINLIKCASLFVPLLPIAVITSCSINDSYLSSGVVITVAYDGTPYYGNVDIPLTYLNGSAVQHKLTYTARCSEQSYKDFTFFELDKVQYPYLTSSNPSYNESDHTITETITFADSAATQQ
jgi:hypothetical protein